MTETETYLVPAVAKSIMILEYITNSREGCSLREIYTGLGLAKTSAFSILNTLIHCGLIRKDRKGRYIPTLKLTAMGMKARETTNEIQFVRPLLEKLRDNTGFTVFYCIYDNGEQIVVEKLDGFSSIIFNSYIGQRKRMNTSSNGKAMAAFLPRRELDLVLSKGMDKLTPKSICDEAAFLAHLEEVRRQGYAVDDGEGELGIRCIGAPVFMYGGRLYGAVSISTLNDSLPLSDIPKYAELLLETTSAISGDLGYAGER